MKKKFLISLLIIGFLSIFFINNEIKAVDTLDDMISGAKDFLVQGDSNAGGTDYSGFNESLTVIFNTFLTIGTIVATIVIAIMGILFMTAASEDKAKIKESLMPFIIGCIVMFGAFTIWKIVVNMGALLVE